MDDLQKKKGSPNVLITTSHNPSHFLRRVGKLLSYTIPFSEKLNRGSLNIQQIHNYCWNNDIKLLFILKDSETKNSAFLNFYDLSKSRTPMNATIRLTNFYFPRKGDSKTRIDSKGINLEFSHLVNEKKLAKIQENMRRFFHPHLPQTKHSNLNINFQKITGSQITGVVTRPLPEEILPVFAFEVTFPRDE